MNKELWKIPPSWSWAKIEDVGRVVSGGTPSTKEPSFWGDEVVWFSPADLTGYRAKYIARGAKSLSQRGLSNSSAQLMPQGTVMFSSRAPIGYVAISSVEAATNQGFKSVIPAEGIFNEYLYYYLKAAKHLAEERATGTTFKEISGSAFSKLPLPLAPVQEQRRIVAKIEELFSELDKGVEALTTVREQLSVHRRAILKHAFQGKFTPNWRTRTQSTRIAHEMSAREIAEEALGSLPNGWGYVRLQHLIDPERSITYGVIKLGAHVSDGVPTLRSSDVRRLRLDLDSVKRISPEIAGNYRRTFLKGGEVLITVRGTLGGVAVVPPVLAGWNISREVAMIAPAEVLDAAYLQYMLASPQLEVWFKGQLRGMAYTGINIASLKEAPIALCSIEEQREIARVLAEQLSLVNSLEKEIDEQLEKVPLLRHSIQVKAFSGQLVAQDPNDEPASVLLERINGTALHRRSKGAPAEPSGIVVPFPHKIPSIPATDLHAGIIALAYDLHAKKPGTSNTFGHVKAEKIIHLVEYHLGIDLERTPVKDAAGPNDFRRLLKVEHRANMKNWFGVKRSGNRYVFTKKHGFTHLLATISQALGEHTARVEALIKVFLPMDTQQAEIFATIYAAWNNLLLTGNASPSDEEIVTEARECWTESKLKIDRQKFFNALGWMKKNDLVPRGIGRLVEAKAQ